MQKGRSTQRANRRPTRNDVAALAGVSTAVVSYVVNDGPRNVAPETKQRVLDAVRELGYEPNDIARSLRAQKSNVIGLVAPSAGEATSGAVALGVGEVLAQESYLLTACNADREMDQVLQCARLLVAKRVDGVVILSIDDSAALLALFAEAGTPVVVAGVEVSGVPSVFADAQASGRLATEHLLELGHTRIAVARRSKSQESRRRHRGYKQALHNAGIPFDADLAVNVNLGVGAGAQAMEQLLALDKPPSALIAHHDLTAIGAMGAAEQAGLNVPRDFSIVSSDNLELGQRVLPALTTTPTSNAELGRVAAHRLLGLIRGHDVPITTLVDPQIVVRGSSNLAPEIATNGRSGTKL